MSSLLVKPVLVVGAADAAEDFGYDYPVFFGHDVAHLDGGVHIAGEGLVFFNRDIIFDSNTFYAEGKLVFALCDNTGADERTVVFKRNCQVGRVGDNDVGLWNIFADVLGKQFPHSLLYAAANLRVAFLLLPFLFETHNQVSIV